MTDEAEIKFTIRYLKQGLKSKRTPPLYEELMKELGFVKKDKIKELVEENVVIRELEDKNAELIGKVAFLENDLNNAKAQVEKMRNCANCKYYQPINDADYFTCIKDGKHNGENYRSCEFNLEKWEGR